MHRHRHRHRRPLSHALHYRVCIDSQLIGANDRESETLLNKTYYHYKSGNLLFGTRLYSFRLNAMAMAKGSCRRRSADERWTVKLKPKFVSKHFIPALLTERAHWINLFIFYDLQIGMKINDSDLYARLYILIGRIAFQHVNWLRLLLPLKQSSSQPPRETTHCIEHPKCNH